MAVKKKNKIDELKEPLTSPFNKLPITQIPSENIKPERLPENIKPERLPEETKTNIKFNPDKSVDIGIGTNAPKNLSPEEYAAYQGKAGTLSPQVKQLQDWADRERLKTKINKGLNVGRDTQEIIAEIIANEQGGNKEAPTSTLPDVATLLKNNEDKSSLTLRSIVGADVPFETGGTIRENAKSFVKQGIPNILRTAAAKIDIMRSAVTGSKSLKVIEAMETFSSANAQMDTTIELVKMGEASASDAEMALNRAAASINRLESATKKEGQLNLRFWIDEGASLEAQIAEEKDILEKKRLKLLAAEQEAQIAQAKATYGI